MKKFALATLAGLALAGSSFAHCQVPCGIYGDDGRFDTLAEHITTVEKAMKKISSGEENANQTARWVMNKESHAQEIQQIVLDYFLAQRIKPPKDDAGKGKYLRKLEHLHMLIVHAMKAKQTTDLAHVEALRKHLHEFQHLYGGK
jgi:nickel superoxide dismutase